MGINTDTTSEESKQAIGVGRAILVGQLVVNIPVLVIIAVVALLLFRFVHIGAELSIIIGALAGWVWWSIAMPRWRRWALRKGAPADKLQQWGVLTGLVWPKGWIFERTEQKVKN